MERNVWAAYVWEVAQGKEAAIGEAVGVAQPTVGRWLKGESVPDAAATVAKFCRTYGRTPLEGFVAAGMLSADEAGRGLSKASRDMLKRLESVDLEQIAVLRDAVRRGMRKGRPNVETRTSRVKKSS